MGVSYGGDVDNVQWIFQVSGGVFWGLDGVFFGRRWRKGWARFLGTWSLFRGFGDYFRACGRFQGPWPWISVLDIWGSLFGFLTFRVFSVFGSMWFIHGEMCTDNVSSMGWGHWLTDSNLCMAYFDRCYFTQSFDQFLVMFVP